MDSPVETIAAFVDSLGAEAGAALRAGAVSSYIGTRSVIESAPIDFDQKFNELFVAHAALDRSLAVYLFLSSFIDYEIWTATDSAHIQDRADTLSAIRSKGSLSKIVDLTSAGIQRQRNMLVSAVPEWSRLRNGPLSFQAAQRRQDELLMTTFRGDFEA